jgi:hypothetical protein
MTAIFALLISLSALAHSPINFEQISTAGSGCPEGTVSTIVSPDGSTLSLLFDEFRVEVPNYQNQTPSPAPGRGPNYRPPRPAASPYESSKTCNISFTTTLPAGMKATAIEISLQARGNTMMDVGLQGYFSTILVGHRGLANSSGPMAKVVEKKMWTTSRAPVGEDWMTDTKAIVQLASNCATASNRSIKFELKNHLEARILRNYLTKSGIITVDSNDARGMLSFTLSTAPCR